MKRLLLSLLAAGSLLPVSKGPMAQGWSPTSEEENKLVKILGLVPGKVVGEIGAGDGRLAIRAGKAVGPNGRVYATELGASRRDTLKRNKDEARASNVEIVEAQVTSTGLSKECCDAIFMRDVYHHLTAPEEILADIRLALRPDGRLLLIDFEPRSSLSPVDGVRENRRGHGVPITVVVDELKAAGFEVVSQDPDWRSDLYAVLAIR